MAMYPYSTSDLWKDITPIPQLEEKVSVVNIATTDRFGETMGYFRAILAKDELSERALRLTEEVIELNSANYTAWHYRRRCLGALPASFLDNELSYVRQMADNAPKNYQIWHHRRSISALLLEKDKEYLDEELDSTRAYILNDNKNYHVWTYRQWLLSSFATEDVWRRELIFTQELLTHDVRNNSAWNQRHFVLETGLKKSSRTPSGLHKELMFVIQQGIAANVPVMCEDQDEEPVVDMEVSSGIKRSVLLNESLWNYLEDLLNQPHFRSFGKLARFAQQALVIRSDCRFARSLLVEMLIHPRCIAFEEKAWDQDSVR